MPTSCKSDGNWHRKEALSQAKPVKRFKPVTFILHIFLNDTFLTSCFDTLVRLNNSFSLQISYPILKLRNPRKLHIKPSVKVLYSIQLQVSHQFQRHVYNLDLFSLYYRCVQKLPEVTHVLLKHHRRNPRSASLSCNVVVQME